MKKKVVEFFVKNIFKIVGSLLVFVSLTLFVGLRYSLALLSIGLLYLFFNYSDKKPMINFDADNENKDKIVNKKEEK